jgi:flagellar biosynthesis chaperone FliJ
MYRTAAILVLVVVFSGASSYAQHPASDPPATIEGIERLNAHLEDIARSLREIRSNQQLLLMLRQIELLERRLAPLEDEHRRAQDDVRATNEQIAQMAGMAERYREEVDRAVRSGADPLQVPERAEVEHIETMLELQRERLEAAEQRVIEADNDLARGRRRIEILDDKLEELMEEFDP